MSNLLHIILTLLLLFTGSNVSYGRSVLDILGAPTHRIRHHRRNTPAADVITNALDDSKAIAGIQRNLLASLGLENPPEVDHIEMSDMMKQVLNSEIQHEEEVVQEEAHFMEDSANVLLTASKGKT